MPATIHTINAFQSNLCRLYLNSIFIMIYWIYKVGASGCPPVTSNFYMPFECDNYQVYFQDYLVFPLSFGMFFFSTISTLYYGSFLYYLGDTSIIKDLFLCVKFFDKIFGKIRCLFELMSVDERLMDMI